MSGYATSPFHAVSFQSSPAVAVLIAAAAAVLGAASGFLTSRMLARSRSPAPVPSTMVAALTALSWLAATLGWLFGTIPSAWLPVPLVLTTFAVPLAIADFRYRRLPDVLTLPAYPAIAAALAVAATASPGLPLRALLGAMLFGGIHLLVRALSRRSLGAGDVKIAAPAGAVLAAVDWGALPVAAALAAVLTLALQASRRYRDGLPYGPGLLLATCLVAAFPAPEGQVSMGT